MPGNEPLLLYSGSSADFSLVSWPESPSRSYFLAIKGQDARRKISRALGSDSGVLGAVEKQLGERGGILASVEDGGSSVRLNPNCWRTQDYQPPDKLVVIGPGETVTEKSIGSTAISLGLSEFALLPIDASSQQELHALLQHVETLPGDLRSAILRTIASAGTLEPQRPNRPPSIKLGHPRKLPWLWLSVALLGGLLVGGAVSPPLWKHLAAPPAGDVPAPSRVSLETALSKLEDAMREPKENIQKEVVTGENLRNAAAGVACLKQPPAMFAASGCTGVNWNTAIQTINALTASVNKAPLNNVAPKLERVPTDMPGAAPVNEQPPGGFPATPHSEIPSHNKKLPAATTEKLEK